jgi:pimeloyl-ACP methyl ester carboxylesterase
MSPVVVVLIAIVVVVAAILLLKPTLVSGLLVDAAIKQLRNKAGMKLDQVSINGFRITYLDSGTPTGAEATDETVLLVHGFGADKDNWTRMAALLTPRYRVIALDLPGFGDSDRPDSVTYTVPEQVQRVAAFAAALKLERFHLGGNSMGGFIAGLYAIAYPQQLLSLWLLDPAGVDSGEHSDMFKQILAGQPVPLIAHDAASYRELLAYCFTRPPQLPGSILRVLGERAAERAPLNTVIFDAIRNRSGSLEAPLKSLSSPLATPTLIVWGDGDRVLHPSGAAVLHAMLPNSEVSMMPAIGHLPMMEAPAVTAKHWLAFQSRLKAA